MPASAAEMRDEDFRGAIHHLRLLCESGRGGDIAGDPQDLFDPVEPTDGFRKRGEAQFGADGSGTLRRREIDLSPHLALEEEFIAAARQLPADIGNSAVNDDRHVVAARRIGLWKMSVHGDLFQ
jgi:hypothetical protein